MQQAFEQALALHKSGNFPQAEQAYRNILNQSPKQAAVAAQLALLLCQTRKEQASLPYFQIALEQLPEAFDLACKAAEVASQCGENLLAENWLEKALAWRPKDIKANEQYAGVLIANHKEKAALEAAKQLIRLDPKNASAYNIKGMAQSRLGDTDKGYKSFQKALKLNPGQLGVIRNLILYGKNRREPLLEKIIPQLEQNLAQPGLQPVVRMNIAYVLSMYFEQQKQSERSFRFLKMGNDINREGYSYQHDQTQKQFGLMQKVLNQELADAFAGKGIDTDSPIFILGMPRSGTTLIEQILSSHSQVGAEGEIHDLRQAVEARGEAILGDTELAARIQACSDAAQEYIDRVGSRRSEARFTDKMPYNFLFVGLIAMAMPGAKIIHCTRDPLETCFSIYKQNFSGSHAYTNNLVELGEYYNAYLSLMAHWKAMFGERIYEANYERMIDNSEAEIKSLLNFCGLEMEEKCLSFHKNKRAVRTASVAQVRQPIYKDALKASTPYVRQLEPLIEVLESGKGAALL